MQLVVHARKLYTPIGNKVKKGSQMSQIERYENVFICVEDGRIVDLSDRRPSI